MWLTAGAIIHQEHQTRFVRVRWLTLAVMAALCYCCAFLSRESCFLMDAWPFLDGSLKPWLSLRPAAGGMALPQPERHVP